MILVSVSLAKFGLNVLQVVTNFANGRPRTCTLADVRHDLADELVHLALQVVGTGGTAETHDDA